MEQASDAFTIEQDERWYRVDAVLLDVHLADWHRFVAQERVIGIAYLNDVAKFLVGRRRPAAFHIAKLLRRRDDRETPRAVLVEEPRDDGTLGLAVGAPVRPEEKEDHLSLQLAHSGHTRSDVRAPLDVGRGLSLDASSRQGRPVRQQGDQAER